MNDIHFTVGSSEEYWKCVAESQFCMGEFGCVVNENDVSFID